MATKTFHGSCHCKAVRFEADIDLSAGTSKCNCSYCGKVRGWGTVIKPAGFRLLSGEAALGEYQFGMLIGHHRFCRTCGVRVYSHGHLDVLGGDFVSIVLATLDDLDPRELLGAPVMLCDGLNNAWHRAPEVTAHM